MTTTKWQDTLATSVKKAEQGAKYKKLAGQLLWDGAQAAITEWIDGADSDDEGEQLQADVNEAMGNSRKGDASKIKTVALAVVGSGLVLAEYDNLSKAYAEAIKRTKTVKVHAAEDEAADEAVQNINAPKTATKAEGAALIVMATGVDEAARLLLAALGTENHAAHKAFLRAIAQEAAGLIPKPEPKPKAEPKAKTAKKASAKPASEKAKAPAPAKAKAKPVKKAAKKVAPEPDLEEPTVEADDMFADLDDEADEAPAPVKKAAKPVRRGPVRR